MCMGFGVFKMFSKNFYTALNIGIVLCSIIESYMFPFAVIKWMIIITKYGGLGSSLLKLDEPNETKVASKTHSIYSLQLITCNGQSVNSERFCKSYSSQLSLVTLIVTNKQWTQVNL